jgi:hypothetical protein
LDHVVFAFSAVLAWALLGIFDLVGDGIRVLDVLLEEVSNFLLSLGDNSSILLSLDLLSELEDLL